MTELLGTAVVVRSAPSSKATAAKRIARMVGVGAVSVGMVGVFAFPAYAVPEVQGTPDGAVVSQSFVTEDADAAIPTGSVSAELIPVVEEPAQAPATAGAAVSANWLGDIPAGAGAQGLVSAALAQVGVNQDCTDLVQNSLAAIGLTTSRLKGGPDLGVHSFAAFGKHVTNGNYAPGDILMWGNYHTAIYIGNGQAVHGGFGGNRTVVASAFIDGTPTMVVRVG